MSRRFNEVAMSFQLDAIRGRSNIYSSAETLRDLYRMNSRWEPVLEAAAAHIDDLNARIQELEKQLQEEKDRSHRLGWAAENYEYDMREQMRHERW